MGHARLATARRHKTASDAHRRRHFAEVAAGLAITGTLAYGYFSHPFSLAPISSATVIHEAAVGNFFQPFTVARPAVPSKPASTVSKSVSKIPKKAAVDWFDRRRVKTGAFRAGEKLNFNVVYKGMVVGHSSLNVEPLPALDGRPRLRFLSTARSTSFFDHIFKVRDSNVSDVDARSLYSLSFQQNLREGNYRAQRQLTVNKAKRSFDYSENVRGKPGALSGPLAEPLSDILSVVYYVRTLKLERGSLFRVAVLQKGRVYGMPVKVLPDLKTIKTPAGNFECLQIEPKPKEDSLFKSEGGRLIVYLSNDRRRLPVMIEARISVGVVTARLVKTEGLTEK